jgi:hypothetical protein
VLVETSDDATSGTWTVGRRSVISALGDVNLARNSVLHPDGSWWTGAEMRCAQMPRLPQRQRDLHVGVKREASDL